MTSSVQRSHHQFTAVKCREVWESKPVLQEIYSDLYRRIIRACRAVKIVEVGGGSQILKQFSPDVLSFGIVPLSWLDCIAKPSAYLLRSYSTGNLVLFDDLHHIEIPARFLANLLGVLLPGDRIIFVELAITPLSWQFYFFFHHEPVVMSADPLVGKAPDPEEDSFLSNQAIPTLLVTQSHAAYC